MTTAFKQTLAVCGLSQQEAAGFFDVRLDTIKSWCADRNRAPSGAWSELATLYDRMDEVAQDAADLFDEQNADNVEFTYSGERGQWPSVRCAMTVEAMARLRIALNES